MIFFAKPPLGPPELAEWREFATGGSTKTCVQKPGAAQGLGAGLTDHGILSRGGNLRPWPQRAQECWRRPHPDHGQARKNDTPYQRSQGAFPQEGGRRTGHRPSSMITGPQLAEGRPGRHLNLFLAAAAYNFWKLMLKLGGLLALLAFLLLGWSKGPNSEPIAACGL